ncbi:hypothetical protein [Streptomyces sp. TS71-3]|uniref:hypothetical protein n=1 Tax=Streptomyces sp. TS71-3 TaxID=2733862 RepID=UPI001B25D7E0|nr:hypothetical protein [Streptomyces sp. TS71-3]GHJ41263.1 hypothetical protein Sm713_68720 [Streptomyces sp. TS71-3]
MTVGLGFRSIRAAVFAAVCVLLASLGHVLMSGATVPWWALGASVAGAGAAGWAFGGRERGPIAVTAFTVAVQTALHVCFAFAQSTGRAPAPGGSGPAAHWARHMLCGADPGPAAGARAYRVAVQSGLLDRMAMGQHATGAGAGHPAPGSAGTGLPTMSMPMGSMAGHGTDAMASMGHQMTGLPSWGMTAAHLAAAVLCGLWLARGEKAAFRVLSALASRAFAPLRLALAGAAPVPPPDRRPLRDFSHRRPRRLLLVHALTTRGPPRETAVV